MTNNNNRPALPHPVIWDAARPAAPRGYEYVGTGRRHDREGILCVRWELRRKADKATAPEREQVATPS